jgi:hypothetical protein
VPFAPRELLLAERSHGIWHQGVHFVASEVRDYELDQFQVSSCTVSIGLGWQGLHGMTTLMPSWLFSLGSAQCWCHVQQLLNLALCAALAQYCQQCRCCWFVTQSYLLLSCAGGTCYW